MTLSLVPSFNLYTSITFLRYCRLFDFHAIHGTASITSLGFAKISIVVARLSRGITFYDGE